MRERLVRRVGRIISGSFNSLVDTIENAAPEAVMSEALREVDGAIEELRAELGRVVANKHLANKRMLEENTRYEDLIGKIELAVGEGRDDLAEAAVAHQLDIEAQIPVLEATIKDCGDQEKEMEGYLNALLAKKRQMQEELREFRKSRADGPGSSISDEGPAGGKPSQVENRIQKAESAFERVLEKATGLPGTSGAADRKTAAQLAELESMARTNRVQERLAAIKGKMDKQ